MKRSGKGKQVLQNWMQVLLKGNTTTVHFIRQLPPGNSSMVHWQQNSILLIRFASSILNVPAWHFLITKVCGPMRMLLFNGPATGSMRLDSHPYIATGSI